MSHILLVFFFFFMYYRAAGIRTHTSRKSETSNGNVNANSCAGVASTLGNLDDADCSCESGFCLSRDPHYGPDHRRCDPLSHGYSSLHPVQNKKQKQKHIDYNF